MTNVKEKAAQQRYKAKRLFGEAIERGGWLNDDLPMARFVDAVIDAAILEMVVIQQDAMKPKDADTKLGVDESVSYVDATNSLGVSLGDDVPRLRIFFESD